MTIEDNRPNSDNEPREFLSAVALFTRERRPRILRPLAWRILITIVVLIALTFLGLWAGAGLLEAAPAPKPAQRPAEAPPAQSASSPLVLAFYYSWFDENTWTYDQLSDMPTEHYVSRDRAVMGRHIDQAKAAGIDAFIFAWYGPAGGTNQTEPNLAAMLDEAAARDFRIGILFETDGPFFGGVGDVTAALQHAQNTHYNHPAYLRVDGRPVVFYWRPTIYGVETWRNIRAQADPGYNSIWISEGVNTGYLDVFDGHHLYSNTWNPPADLHAVNRRYAGEVAAARERLGAYKFWVATVMPGYDDVRIRRGAGGFAQDRQGGAYYTRSWDAAIASNPNWIVINSFNEWPEGSYIEPSVNFGDLFMGLTGQHSGQFKSGGGVPVALEPPAPPESAPEPTPEPTPVPEPETPTAFVNVAALNLRAGPGVDFPIVTQLSQGAALPITGSHPGVHEWWQVETQSGTGWVHQDFVDGRGPLEQIAQLDDAALPAPEPVAESTAPASDAAPASAEADSTDSVFAAAAQEAVSGLDAAAPADPEVESSFAQGQPDPAETADFPLAASAAVELDTDADTDASSVILDSQADATRPQGTSGSDLEHAMQTLSQAIRTGIHPVLNAEHATLYPYLSR